MLILNQKNPWAAYRSKHSITLQESFQNLEKYDYPREKPRAEIWLKWPHNPNKTLHEEMINLQWIYSFGKTRRPNHWENSQKNFEQRTIWDYKMSTGVIFKEMK